MSQNRNPQETKFVDFIRDGNFEEVQSILLENGSNDKSNPLLKKSFGRYNVSQQFSKLHYYEVRIRSKFQKGYLIIEI